MNTNYSKVFLVMILSVSWEISWSEQMKESQETVVSDSCVNPSCVSAGIRPLIPAIEDIVILENNKKAPEKPTQKSNSSDKESKNK